MRYLGLFIYVVFSNLLHAQRGEDYSYKSVHTYHSIGVHNVANDSIFAEDIAFVNNITDFVFDSINQILLSYFSLYGDYGKTNYDYVTAYSLEKKKVLWSKLVDRTKEHYDFMKDRLYVNTGKTNGLFDIAADTFIWKSKSRLYVHPDLLKNNVILASTQNSEIGYNVCSGLDANTGKVLWVNDSLDIKQGIISEPIVRGEYLYFINEYLIRVNAKTGEFWQSERKMNKILGAGEKFFKELGLSIFSTAMTMGMLSIVGGSNLLPISIYDIGSVGLKTNAPLLLDDSCFVYVVGINGMQKYDSSGQVLNAISHSSIDNNASIWLINNFIYYSEKGSYIQNGEKKPLMASYFYLSRLNRNLETEKRFHLIDKYESLNGEMGKFHVETNYLGDTFYILFRNGFFTLDTNLNLTGKFSRPKKEDPEYTGLLTQDFYVQQDSLWEKHKSNNGFVYLERLDQSIDVINSDFRFVRNLPKSKIYKIVYRDEYIEALANSAGQSFLIDKNARTIIDMLRLEKAIKYKNRYILANLNGYYIIDSEQLIK